MSDLWYVSLEKFLMKLAVERGLIRKNKGNSIVPLALVNFQMLGEEQHRFFYGVRKGLHLATVCQRRGTVFINEDLSKKYSATSGFYGDYRVLDVRPPRHFDPDRFLRVEAVNVIRIEDLYED